MVEKWFSLSSLLSEGGGSIADTPGHSPSVTMRGVTKRSSHGVGGARNPSVLLEISFSRPETLDESEDEADFGDEGDEDSVTGVDNEATSQGMQERGNDSFPVTDLEDRSRPSTNRKSSIVSSGEDVDVQHDKKADSGPETDPITGQEIDPRNNGPLVKPGVVDFLAVVGCRDIGDQTNDDGSKGWVNSIPECCMLEQFPTDNEFHMKNGR